MDNQELRAMLADLGWSTHDLSENAGRDNRTIRRQLAGDLPIDPPLEAWVRRVHSELAPALKRAEELGPAPRHDAPVTDQ